MSFWPIPLAIALGFTIWGVLIGRGAWVLPALALAAYLAVRAIVVVLPTGFHEVTICALWLCICAIMVSLPEGKVPAFFWALSALTYPALMVFGVRIEWLGLSPIIAEMFAACAFIAVGGGLCGVVAFASSDTGRSGDRLAFAAPGVARCEAGNSCAARMDRAPLKI